ncbi:hypothetical protein CBL_00522 [Carabus blaptoides fortunei]
MVHFNLDKLLVKNFRFTIALLLQQQKKKFDISYKRLTNWFLRKEVQKFSIIRIGYRWRCGVHLSPGKYMAVSFDKSLYICNTTTRHPASDDEAAIDKSLQDFTPLVLESNWAFSDLSPEMDETRHGLKTLLASSGVLKSIWFSLREPFFIIEGMHVKFEK